MKKEKKTISKEVLGIIIGTVVAVVALGAVAFWGLNRDFKADKYVGVILDYTFKGEATDSEGMFDQASHDQMKKQYDENVVAFVEKNITGGIAVNEKMKEKYIALCKDIFRAMKYEVKTVEKVSSEEYEVTVEYQSTNIFGAYMELAAQESGKMSEKVNRGDAQYLGTPEEVNAQMEQEIIVNDYTALQSAYQNVQYDKKEIFVFTVKRGENEAFALDGTALSEFLVKIMNLDVKQD